MKSERRSLDTFAAADLAEFVRQRCWMSDSDYQRLLWIEKERKSKALSEQLDLIHTQMVATNITTPGGLGRYLDLSDRWDRINAAWNKLHGIDATGAEDKRHA